MTVNKRTVQKFDMERFNIKKLSELDVRKECQIKIANRITALENLNDSEDINRVWENIKENVRTLTKENLGLYELKQHNPWFDEECSRFLDQRKQAKMQWLQDSNHNNVDNLNNINYEASISFREKWRKIDELETNSKIKNIRDWYRGISDVKKGCEPRTNRIKEENGDLVTDSIVF